MQALFTYGAEHAKKGTAFESAITGALELRTNTPK